VSAARGTVGLIGLGLLGSAIAERLAGAGFDVAGDDRSEEARRRFGGRTGAAAREAERIVLAVFDTADVEEVVEASKARIYVDCTTGDPERVEALAARLARRGATYVEARIAGGADATRRGEVPVLVGGDASGCEDILAAISANRLHVGAAGMAARAKLAVNLVLGLGRAAVAEGMAFAGSQGIGRERFLEILARTPAASPAGLRRGARMASGDFRPESRIRQHLKDVHLMQQLSRAPLPLTHAHERVLAAAVAAGDGDLDTAAIIRRWENP